MVNFETKLDEIIVLLTKILNEIKDKDRQDEGMTYPMEGTNSIYFPGQIDCDKKVD